MKVNSLELRFTMETPYHLCMETFASELRMNIIKLLLQGPKSVNELTEALHAERSRVSHSLQMLRTCNLVTVEKKGKQSIYAARKDALFSNQGTGILHIIDQHVTHHCNGCAKQKSHKHGGALS